jgi:hypothetical protein
MISATNLIRIQSDHVKGEYELRNIWNGTRIITERNGGLFSHEILPRE